MKKPDRRVQRTRQTLREALVALILEKGYEAVKVDDIVQRANVGRSTFYAHFFGKADLLMSGMDGLREQLRDEQRQAQAAGAGSGLPPLGFSLPLFRHAHAFAPVFRAVTDSRASGIMLQRLRGMLLDIVRDDLSALKTGDPLPLDIVCRFTADALLSVLSGWLEGRWTLAPEEADAAFKRLARPAIAAGLGLDPLEQASDRATSPV